MLYELFSENNSQTYQIFERPDAELILYPFLFSGDEFDGFFELLRDQISWQQEKIKMYGKVYNVPRLTAWYSEENKTYTYSGIKVQSIPWIPVLLQIKKKIEAVSNNKFNSVLLNYYRSGQDGVSWHSDDEWELGDNPVIGSVSFGVTRDFQMKHKFLKDEKFKIALQHGSYLLMQGRTQHHWLHQIPKSNKRMGARINLTYRVIID